jgi:hypothetical protein
MLFPDVLFIVYHKLDWLQCRDCDSDLREHTCNRHLTILIFDHALFIQLNVFDKLHLFHADINSISHKHRDCASDSAIYRPTATGQSHIQIVCGGLAYNVDFRWAHVIFRSLPLYRSQMGPCLKYHWLAAPMIGRIAVLRCLFPTEPSQQRRMLCLYSTRLPWMYARKISLTSIPCAVLRKLTRELKCVRKTYQINRGYSLYGQAIVGQTPCYTLISTTISVPQTVLASISTAVAATLSVKSTTAAVSVIINQVFALSLPCGDDNSERTGLSTGAKAGIGVGAGVGGLILLGLALWLCLLARKRRQKANAEAPVASNTTGPQYGGASNQMYENKQYPAFPPGSPLPGYAVPPGPGSPLNHHHSLGSHTSWSSQTHAAPGHMSLSSDGMRQYGASSPGSPSGYIPEMPAYQVQARSQLHEMPAK